MVYDVDVEVFFDVDEIGVRVDFWYLLLFVVLGMCFVWGVFVSVYLLVEEV